MWPEDNKAYAGRDPKHRITPLTSSVALGAFGFLGTMKSCLLSYGCWNLIQLAVRLVVRYSDWTQKANRKPTLSRYAGNKSQANTLAYQTWWQHSKKYIVRWHQPEWWKELHSLGVSLVNKEQVLACTHRREDLKSLEPSVISVCPCCGRGPESTWPPVR